MNKSFAGLTLKTSPVTKKSWLVDEDGLRWSKRFKVRYTEQAGVLTLVTTDKESLLYSECSRDYIMSDKEIGCWAKLVQLSENIYLVGWRGMSFSTVYCLFDEKLQIVNKGHKFIAIHMLTANLMAVQTQEGWGIIDTVTGQFVEQPKYCEIQQKDGKIMGKVTQIVETEIKVNN